MPQELLRVNNLSKSFAGVNALQNVSLVIEQGKIYCLVGENGSGKSTLIKIIAGVYPADAGEIMINGKQHRHLHPIDAIREGIQVIYQDFSLFANLSVAENIALNTQLAANKRLVNWKEIRAVAQAALQKIQVNLNLDARVSQVSVADKQLIAISKALLQNAKLIIMDEPTSALTRREVQALFGIIKKLQQEGLSFLFVSHKLNEVQEISEKILILRNGQKVIEGDANEFDYKKLVYYMTGHQIDERAYDYKPSAQTAASLCKVVHLTSAVGAFADISFELFPGEIIGITGLLGSGRTELALALFGMHPVSAGTIALNGKPTRIASVQDAIRNGIGYVPEDRLTEGLFLEQAVSRNVVICTIEMLLRKIGLIDFRKLRNHIQTWVANLSIKTASAELPAKTLSGGNQQRVVLAKWLARSPQILLLNGPTVGVDVGSKAELHEIMKRLARQGMGLLVISDDIPELLQTCNRILLMRQGRIVEAFDRPNITENELSLKLMAARGGQVSC